MSGYEPRTAQTRWMREQILAALREHIELNTTELGEAIGWMLTRGWCQKCRVAHPATEDVHGAGAGFGLRPVESQSMQPTMTSMLRHDELRRWRPSSAAVWRWRLGDSAPPALGDLEALEAMFAREAPLDD